MSENRIQLSNGHYTLLPNLEERGVTALSSWVKRSPVPGTPRWEWVITNMPVTVVTGMSSGYTRTKLGALAERRRAERFWRGLGYKVRR